MLMQNFKSAADLEITEPQKEALMKTLVLLETGRLEYVKDGIKFYQAIPDGAPFTGHFNMAVWRQEHPCGTVACIGGTAELVGGVTFDDYEDNNGLLNLFNPEGDNSRWLEITGAQAATALRSYLTTGDARWDLAVA